MRLLYQAWGYDSKFCSWLPAWSTLSLLGFQNSYIWRSPIQAAMPFCVKVFGWCYAQTFGYENTELQPLFIYKGSIRANVLLCAIFFVHILGMIIVNKENQTPNPLSKPATMLVVCNQQHGLLFYALVWYCHDLALATESAIEFKVRRA